MEHLGIIITITIVIVTIIETKVIADLSEEHLVNCLANNGCSGWYSNQYLEDIVGKNGKKNESYSCKIRDTKQANANLLLKTNLQVVDWSRSSVVATLPLTTTAQVQPKKHSEEKKPNE